ncbi:DNA repair protein RecN [Salinisphaera sp. Q1T1-3]|uniref:DNA repair protein RecN n=1 Tax=Salinisphaera sp. Q1T1-3 TaxID=2321229 RepID=UPI000E74A801|nr:DNA repair protein RecN [Salinisphaera sp. Q1T1-3]RJS92737.1 DNA repair protein RecN [Salinisphaera sp. Q1T1-3]
MLAEISIRDFAIIDRLSVEFGPGMTVLSGETGAGKSILVDALNLVLGERADGGAVRDGCERADITARFSLADAPAAAAWLVDHELDGDDECVIRRVVAREGRSRGWVNGTPMPVRELRALGRCLVDIHGQHAHQSLLGRDAQRNLLDEYGEHGDALAAVAQAARNLRETRRAIARIEQRDSDGDSRVDLLRYQVGELEQLGLADDEVADLEAEHKRLASAERLIGDGQRALALLYEAEDGAAAERLGAAERLIGELATIDDGFEPIAELVSSALIQAQEAADSLRRHVENLDIDPQRFTEVENRLGTIRDIARKHHVSAADIPTLTAELQAELAELEGAGARLAELKEAEQAQLAVFHEAAATLSAAREQAASTLGQAITDIIQTLGMPEGEFAVRVRSQASDRVNDTGTDHIEFLIAANPGQSARPLDRVASGGELSRISLAIEVIAATRTRVPTLVFDEVDTGIGGGVAEIVGRQLRRLGLAGQSLCVTHLPQVAAQAAHHLHVAKQVRDGQTRTRIQALDDEARVEELARMLGGVELTEQTRAHAADMIARAAAAPA